MTKRPTINTLTNTASPTYLTQLNQNFTNIKDQFDNTLSLDGSLPNAMNADIDLNSNDLINGGTLSADDIVIGGTSIATQVTNAAASATNAAASASSAAASYDSFDDRYLGPKASNPTVDNDGNALLTGALYFNTVSSEMRVWSGSAWATAYANLANTLVKANNLSDLTNAATALVNLGLTATAVELGYVSGVTSAIQTQLGTKAALASPSFTGQASFPDGTAAAPSIAHTGDLNAGLFFPAADTVAVATAGIEAIRINASGNVGIGTTSPTSRLSLAGTSTGAQLTALTLSNEGLTAGSTVRLSFLTGEDGSVGRTRGLIEALSPASNDGALAFYTRSAGSTAERLRIDASGNVGIGTTSPNAASIIDATSTTKGVRFPNMTTTQKTAIANVAGNVVFDTTLGKLCVNTGSAWQTITSV